MNKTLSSATLTSLQKLYAYYKSLGEKAMAQVPDEQLFWEPGTDGNSIAILVKHLAGNMRSRFRDFLTTDGEKPDRHRDTEFELDFDNRAEMMSYWDHGWNVVLTTLEGLNGSDLDKIIYIRNEGHLVVEAIHRQLGHYGYHVGQIVLLARMIVGEDWNTLSIARGKSAEFLAERMARGKHRAHFTDSDKEEK